MPASRAHVWVAAALLLIFSAYTLLATLPKSNFPGIAIGAIIGVDAVLLARRSRWSSPLTAILAILLISNWAYVSLTGPALGYLRTLAPMQLALSLLPGFALCVAAVYCAYVATFARNGATRT